MISDEDGEQLVRLARRAVEKYLNESIIVNLDNMYQFSQKAGVFVTLNYVDNNEEHLRGCMGFPLPDKKLHQSVIEARYSSHHTGS